MADENLLKKLADEVKKSVLMTADEKIFWLENMKNYPEFVLVELFEKLTTANTQTDDAIKAALKADPEVLSNVKNQVGKLKRNILNARESQEANQENPDNLLEENLKQI